MKCSKCRGLLVEFSEGRLESELDREIWKHVAGCAACRRDLDSFRSSLELMDAAKSFRRIPEPPADFAERVMDRVRQGASAHFPFRRLVFGVAAACCLLVLGAVLLFRVGSSERRSPTPMPDSASLVEVESEIPNGVAAFTSRSDQISDAGISPLHHTKAHISMELVRLLEQTLEIIERGEQEWEVEI